MSDFKGTTLLEADPSVNYEKAVKKFAVEMASSGRLVYAFTSRGSPVHTLLKDIPGLRFFILSEGPNRRSDEGSLETTVQLSDHAVLLSLFDKTVTQNPEKPKAIIFDNISSLIIDAGLQESYKVLKEANEILSQGDVISIFLVLSKAHDEKAMNSIKNLYSGQSTYDATGLHFTKKS